MALKQLKTVIITGGTSNLGKALVKCFIDNNWEVHATVRKTDLAIKEAFNHPNLHYHQMDLENLESIKQTIAHITANIYQLDLLINNAGFVLSGPLESYTDEQIKKQMDVNFYGAVFTTRAILPKMKQQKWGTIINVSSLCGLTTFPILSMYHASKWAIEGFTESLWYELIQFGIRVKIIEPGGIKDNNAASDVEFGLQVFTEYESLINKVHHSNWFPSFSTSTNVAKQMFNIVEENSAQLRHQIGDDCSLLLKERTENWLNETYLAKTKSRIEGND